MKNQNWCSKNQNVCIFKHQYIICSHHLLTPALHSEVAKSPHLILWLKTFNATNLKIDATMFGTTHKKPNDWELVSHTVELAGTVIYGWWWSGGIFRLRSGSVWPGPAAIEDVKWNDPWGADTFLSYICGRLDKTDAATLVSANMYVHTRRHTFIPHWDRYLHAPTATHRGKLHTFSRPAAATADLQVLTTNTPQG